MEAILNSAILNSSILDSSILVLSLKHTHTCQDWFPPFAQKKTSLALPSPPFAQKNFTHSFWLNLMMVAIFNSAILNSAILDSASVLWNSDTLFSSLRCTQKHSPSTLALTQTNSIWLQTYSFWLNLMMVAIFNSAILNSAILDSASVLWNSDTLFSSLRCTQKHSPSTLALTQTNSIWLKLIHSDSTWWRQPSWISQLGFRHFGQKNSLIHSDLTWWWQPSWILPTWFQPFCTKNFTHSFWLNFMMAAILNLAILDSGILVFPLKPTHTCQDWFPPFAEKKISLTLPSPPFTQKNFTHSF